MRVLSLFDGIACGRVALAYARVPVDCYDAYEIEKSAIAIATHNWNDIRECGDVFNAQWQQGQYDLLIGGSPCTYWSSARMADSKETGDGNGVNLFNEYVRALNTVKPKYFLYENVDRIDINIRNYISSCLGVQPVKIDSGLFSAQVRKRNYWTNIPIAPLPKSCNLVYADIAEVPFEETHELMSFPQFTSYRNTARGVQLAVPGKFRATTYYTYKNAKTTTLISNRRFRGCQVQIVAGNSQWTYPTVLECERLQTLPDNYTRAVPNLTDHQRWSGIGNGWTAKVIAHILKGVLNG